MLEPCVWLIRQESKKKKKKKGIKLLHGGLRLLSSGQMEVSVCAVTLFWERKCWEHLDREWPRSPLQLGGDINPPSSHPNEGLWGQQCFSFLLSVALTRTLHLDHEWKFHTLKRMCLLTLLYYLTALFTLSPVFKMIYFSAGACTNLM